MAEFKRKYLITGATGFVGRPLVSRMIEQLPGEYYCITRQKRENHLINWIELDLTDTVSLNSIIEEVQPDVLIHLAWYVEPKDYLHSEKNIQFLESSKHLFELFLRHGGKQIIATGTCFEYDLQYGFLQPYITPTKANNLYAQSKINLFNYLGELKRQYDFQYAWCRLFYMFGEYEYEERLVPSIITNLLQGKQPICSEGMQLRDYLYVKDVAKIIVEVIKENLTGAINISSGYPLTVYQLGKVIEEKLNKQNAIQFGGYVPKFEEPHLIMGTPIRKLIPKVELTITEQAIQQTIDWWIEKGVSEK